VRINTSYSSNGTRTGLDEEWLVLALFQHFDSPFASIELRASRLVGLAAELRETSDRTTRIRLAVITVAVARRTGWPSSAASPRKSPGLEICDGFVRERLPLPLGEPALASLPLLASLYDCGGNARRTAAPIVVSPRIWNRSERLFTLEQRCAKQAPQN
jgi:hypothetical protein